MRINKNIIQVSYGRTINMGNYESTRIDLVSRVDENEDWLDVLEELKEQLLKQEKIIKKQGF